MTKAHIRGIVLGLSGGIDSALCLSLAVDAMGASNVKGLLSNAVEVNMARVLCEALVMKLYELNIVPQRFAA